MAKPYPIVPVAWVDGISQLNASLTAYQMAVEGILRRFATEGASYNFESVIAGLDNLFTPVLEGYQDIHSQIDKAREMRLVGIASIADPEEEHANR